MGWPSPVSAGTATTAGQYNGLLNAVQHWQGDVDAGGFSLLNAAGITANGAVTFGAPDQVHFGNDWQAFTPTVTGSGSMTVTPVNVMSCAYLRRGAEVLYYGQIEITVGGTPDLWVNVTLPVPPAATMLMCYAVAPGGTWAPAFGYIDQTSGGKFVLSGGSYSVAWPAGTMQFMFVASYRV
jgi:hypothetical protein